MPLAYLDKLYAVAEVCGRAEMEFRSQTQHRLEAMAAERTRAYRRYHLVKEMVEAARPVAEGAACVAAQTACILAAAGWSEDDGAFDEIREQLGRVAVLIYADVHGEAAAQPEASAILEALEAFEIWYRERFNAEFPALLPRAANSFQPLVDF